MQEQRGRIMSRDSAEPSKGQQGLIRAASFIVDKRMLFFLTYIIATIFSLVASNWVQVNNDLTDYLPDSTETTEGMKLMEEEFTTFGSAKIMISNITFEEALEVQETLEEVDGVSSVTFAEEDADQEDFEEYYTAGAALYVLTFDYDENDDRALESLDLAEAAVADYDYVVTTDMGDQLAEQIDAEVQVIMVVVAVILVGVLLFTTQSVGEIPVLCITFIVSILLNSGTNFLLGEISFISNSVSSVLQLALSIDYAIILMNSFKEERGKGYDVRDAAVVSLAESIPEILSSSLTTICGLLAMSFMQFRLGGDMGMVLIKAILISLLCVFTLMPGLIVVASGFIEKTRHRNLIPKISPIGRFAFRTRRIVTVLFCFVFVAAFVLMQSCPYVYGYETLDTVATSEQQEAEDLMEETFGTENFVALVIPGGDYDAEAQLIADMEARDDVDYCMGLANTEAMDGYMLTDSLGPRQFSELLEMDYEIAELLYSLYAMEEEEMGRIIGGIGSYEIRLMDMMMFVYEKVEEGYVTLDEETDDTLSEAYDAISDGRKQLEGDNYDRIMVYLSVPLPEEDEGTFDTVEELHDLAQSYYEEGEVYVVGNSTSQRDLRDSFEVDNVVVTALSMLFVLVVLLFTFKSAGMPVLLILVIEGAIAINFAWPTLAQSKIFFIAELIVSSIQMGANIDYAIVMSTRYTQERKNGMDRQGAIIEALNCAFPTIVTSGTIMVCAGVSIGMMTSDACIAGIGVCLARGTIISIILVLFVLPQLLICGDRLIQKTAFDIYRPVQQREASGEIRIDGAIRGTINGTVIGTMNVIVRGDVNAVVVYGDMKQIGETEDLTSFGEMDELDSSGEEDGPPDIGDESEQAVFTDTEVEDGIEDITDRLWDEQGGDGNEEQ